MCKIQFGCSNPDGTKQRILEENSLKKNSLACILVRYVKLMDKDDIYWMFVQRVGSENILYCMILKTVIGVNHLDKTLSVFYV
jgi:hypothetical protein